MSIDMVNLDSKSVAENDCAVESNETTSDVKVDYDQLLSAAGELGLYQILIMFKTSLFYVFGAFVYFSQVFITKVSKNHWCWIPELDNMTPIERRTLAIPEDKDSPLGYSHCTSYIANWTEVLLTGCKPDKSWATQKCQYGWEYNKTEIPYPTISSELGWVCDKYSYQAISQSLFFVGSIIGGFLVGWIADRFGRIPATVFANVVGCVAGIASTFTRNFVEFTICRIFMGMSYDNCMFMTYILVLEYTAPKYRTLISNMSCAIFFTLGVTTLPWISLACGDWKVISLVTSIPLSLSLFLPFLLPESPRWLLTKDRADEVIMNVKAIAKINKRNVPANLVEQFQRTVSKAKKEKSSTLLELLKRRTLRNVFICICAAYGSCVIIFDTLIRSVGSLKYDFFISFTLVSFTEFPSLVLLSFTLDLIGRKWLTIISLMVCSTFSFIIPFIGGGFQTVMCAVAARFACNVAIDALVQWSAELLPTSIRGSGTLIVHICGYIATCITPFIAYSDNYVSWLPLAIVGTISLISAAFCLYLPETARKELPQTLNEMDHLMEDWELWDIPYLRKKVF